MGSQQPILQTISLSKHFGTDPSRVVNVLQELDFILQTGERIAIIGASGVGKSTLLHILGAVDQPSTGQVLHRGQDIFQLDEKDIAAFRNRHIGFVFQFHHLLPEFDALENIMMPELMAGTPRHKAQRKAMNLLERVGLSPHLKRRIGTLSGGEQQRVAVARALIRQPDILLADEPTGNLDTRTGRKIHDLLVDLNERNKLSMVVATHNIELAGKMNKVFRLQEGKLEKLQKTF